MIKVAQGAGPLWDARRDDLVKVPRAIMQKALEEGDLHWAEEADEKAVLLTKLY